MAGSDALADSSDESKRPGASDIDLGDAAVFTAQDSATPTAARSRPREMPALPGSGAAIFSTDGGRHPRRSVPIPPPPVIVRSVRVQGVVNFADYWRSKLPDFYHCLFPGHGWAITDLWDDCDIHLESPAFLGEVLRFIVEDNHQSALKFAREWCHRQQFSGKIEKLAADFSHLEDSVDRYSFVDDFFSEYELEVCPRPFLIHALWGLKQTMHNYMAERNPISTASSTEALLNRSTTYPEVTNRAASSTDRQQAPITVLPCKTNLEPPLVQANYLLDPTVPRHMVTSHRFGRQDISSVVPFPPPPGPKLHYGAVPSLQQPTGVPAYFGEKVRNTTKTRRSESNSLLYPLQMHTWSENIRLPSSGYVSHPSGPHKDSRQLVSNMAMGPSIFASGQTGPDYLPSTVMTSATVHPSHTSHPHMVAPVALPPAGPLLSRFEDRACQQFGPTSSESHVGPFADMANMQYPPMRALNTRPYPRHSSQGMKSATLYNPYDATRPEKADFATSGTRKNIRGHFASNAGRGRNYSTGAFDRAGNRSNEWDHTENMKTAGYSVVKVAPMRDHKYPYESDPTITKDKEFGCDHDFIGPKNTTVRQLFVRNLPDGTTSHEVRVFFEDHAGITPATVEIKPLGDRKDVYNAFVYFRTTEDARVALRAQFPLFKGREVPVSVARRHFQVGNHHRPMKQEPYCSTVGTGTCSQSNPYSPQDARSDLHHMSGHQRRLRAPSSDGSPEGKQRRYMPAKSAKDPEAGSSRQEVGLKKADQVEGDGVTVQDKAAQEDVDSVRSDDGSGNTAPQEYSNRLPDMVPIHKDATTDTPFPDSLEADKSDAASPKTITESVPVDAHNPLLFSPTKVALPPQSRVSQEISLDKPETAATFKNTRDIDAIVATPVQEDVASEDDQKNDLSFHSAQESQLKDKDEKSLHETIDVQCENAMDDDDKEIEHTQLEEHQSDYTRPQCNQKAKRNGLIAFSSGETKEVTSTSDKAQTETGKKQGAKRTESLNPYSKASKAQLKKIKEKEKKQKKGKEGEKKKDREEVTINGVDQKEIKLSNETGAQGKIESRSVAPAGLLKTDSHGNSTHGKHNKH